MPTPVPVINRATGEQELLEDDAAQAAIASGKYLPVGNSPDVVAVHRFGADTYASPEQAQMEGPLITPKVDAAQAELAIGHAARATEERGLSGAARAALGGGASGLSFGLLSPFAQAQEFHPLVATGAAIAAPLLIPGGEFAELGELGLLADAEGAERAVGSLSSRALYGGEVGAAEEGARSLERGLLKGTDRLASEAEELTPGALARRQVADDITSFRKDLKEQKLYLAWKDGAADAAGTKLDGISSIGKRTFDAERRLDRLIDNPYNFAEKPEQAMTALQKHQAALEELLSREGELRTAYAGDQTAARVSALERVPAALERNKMLQGRLRGLADIDAASEGASSGDSMIGQLLGGSVFHHVSELAKSAIPIPFIGPMLGAKAAELAKGLVLGKLGGEVGASVARTGEAVKAFIGGAATGPAPAMIASDILGNARFAPAAEMPAVAGAAGAAKTVDTKTDRAAQLAANFNARSSELRSQTAYNAAGVPEMTKDARMALAKRLDPVRAVSPQLADRMETTAARVIEYVSGKIPRQPDLPRAPGGPDTWRPSDMAMRSFARTVAAATNPHVVEQHLAHGTITPEDAEAYRVCHPAQFAALTARIDAELPKLQSTLPFKNRLALSVLTGRPVDPALDPRILNVLQAGFAEPGTNGGTQQPTTQPQFGSIKKSAEPPTPGQKREGGTET